jgi:hypothetical protein
MPQKKLIILVMILLAVAGVVVVLNSLTKKAAPSPGGETAVREGIFDLPKFEETLPPPPQEISSLSGQIQSVNQQGRYLIITVAQPKSDEYKILVNDETVIADFLVPGKTKTGKTIGLQELKAGDYLEVEVKGSINASATLVATFIQPIRL